MMKINYYFINMGRGEIDDVRKEVCEVGENGVNELWLRDVKEYMDDIIGLGGNGGLIDVDIIKIKEVIEDWVWGWCFWEEGMVVCVREGEGVEDMGLGDLLDNWKVDVKCDLDEWIEKLW